ncbi:stage II sporulation protein AA (anti-sigma F factor antagonist) [Nonomuraea solani]|uniref:Anti-sigma factor antagonist n=1 Tax=Nonomuraea solani TaxID=1144553 RepID=A0A1H6EZ10_9ACTN|nr:STAS domain-containing protein [Nonomuraea solani]SEH03127.1 stage II sporulation protein AA (anti-sigma F factor antagonist) [Nonomuraea solani]
MSPLYLDSQQLITGMLVSVVGEVDHSNADQLESYVSRTCRPGEPVVLDLGGLTFLDSRGLHALLRLHAAMRQQEATLYLAAVQDVPARVLQITGIWDAMNIHSSVEGAIAAVLSAFAAPVHQSR